MYKMYKPYEITMILNDLRLKLFFMISLKNYLNLGTNSDN